MTPAHGLAVVLATVFVAGLSAARLLGVRGGWVRRGARVYLLGSGCLAFQGFGYGLLGWRLDLWGVLGPWWLIAAAAWFWNRARGRAGHRREPTAATPRADRVTALIIALLGAASLAVALAHPIHTADAANIYGMNARQIAAHGGLSADILRQLHTAGHIEYPPLIAFSEALVFMATGSAGYRLVLVVFVLFFIAFAVLIHELVRDLVSPWWGAACTLLLILSPEVLLYASRGYADLPLAAFLAAALVHGMRAVRTGSTGEAARSAVFLVLAAFTKNEGLALAVPGGLALGVVLIVRGRRRGLGWLAGGMALGLLSWPVYRMVHGLRVVDLQGAGPARLLEEPERLVTVAREIFAVMARRGLAGDFMWGSFWLFLAAVLVVALLRCTARDARHLWSLVAHAAPLLGQLALYAVVLAMTAADLRWHLQTALPRMMLHVTPAAIVLLAVSTRSALGSGNGCGSEQRTETE